MTHSQIVKKLIGPINPIGDSNEDENRLRHLKEMCELASELIIAINNVERSNRGSMEHSVKLCHSHAFEWLNETQDFLVGR